MLALTRWKFDSPAQNSMKVSSPVRWNPGSLNIGIGLVAPRSGDMQEPRFLPITPSPGCYPPLHSQEWITTTVLPDGKKINRKVT